MAIEQRGMGFFFFLSRLDQRQCFVNALPKLWPLLSSRMEHIVSYLHHFYTRRDYYLKN